MNKPERRIVVVANRLPVAWIEKTEQWRASPGGLVSALTPILERTRGTWVGWSGMPDHDIEPFEHSGIHQLPVDLTKQEYLDFYVGFCNGTLWPLYHTAVRAPEFHRHWWRPYVEVNQKFASAAATVVGRGDIAWIQDYQLQLVPKMLREESAPHRIGFYLHVPFPPPELFATLPWRAEVLDGLLGADVIAFQSKQSRANFSLSSRRIGGAKGTSERLRWDGREIELQVAPIGIDAESFSAEAKTEETDRLARRIRAQLGDPDVVILGVDRLDYTKGIDQRMRALQTLLERRPDLTGKVAFIQIAVPSRQDVDAYKTIRRDIEALVGRINGDYGRVGRPPIHYLYRSIPSDELIAYYRAADIMLVTPLRDGMNLVAKEFVATRYDNTGLLVLSEFAGAAEELTHATLVNPYDLDGMAESLEKAIISDPGEPSRQMRNLRRSVASHDVFWWADQCLGALNR